ncbi:hypothetical protein [Novosphingobium aquimarinum]|uniref:hypothetical protein n=1 Tax=Novosphingobium aquimarinum TaxID=2682494 RepID=UPI0012EC1488|nr:hypothetical protein [Novosphingobium aquimarinum]
MVRTAQAPALNAKIYRHFAVATLMITGAVALIASDQDDTAQAAAETGGQADTVELAIRKDSAERTAAKRSGRSFDRWGIDHSSYDTNNVNYDVYASSQMSSKTPTAMDIIKRMRAKGPPPGMTYEEWMAYLANQEAMLAAAQSTGETSGQGSIEDMIAESRERAGASSSEFE